MKDAFRNSLPDRRGSFQQAGLGFVRLLSGHGGLNLLDERLYSVESRPIPLMAPVCLASSSYRRFMNAWHR
jgi:hypothetical protein